MIGSIRAEISLISARGASIPAVSAESVVAIVVIVSHILPVVELAV
jgi:hypothetical protein